LDLSITTKIDVTSNTRYDIGICIGLNGAYARVDNRTNACLVQTLREIDANNSLNGGRIGRLEGEKMMNAWTPAKGDFWFSDRQLKN
jgi:hypothetical protein